MTSEGETQKTSEFLRRRKLRLQQVREQSKDIAKKIRQRAKVEKVRQVVELDQKKERDYIQCQERVVKKLEELYSRGLDNVGSSHRQARGLTQPVSESFVTEQKTDLSHVRGREAAAELRKQKQQKFNEIKQALDRKVQAREAANVLSREKSTTTTNKLSSKSSSTKLRVDEVSKSNSENINENCDIHDKDLPKEVPRNDMGTQWDLDLLPPEWEPNIPALDIPKDGSIKESGGDSDKNTDKQKRPNLFALSDEMPWSLRGGTHTTCDTRPSKFTSTLVSEYIQNRALRLRESEVSTSMKNHSEDLKNVRQTIIRSRPLQSEGSNFCNICHVIEGQMVPMPTWRAETSCQCQSPRISHHNQSLERKQFTNVTHSDINKIFNSIHPMKPNSEPNRVPKKTRPFILQTFFGHNKQSVNPNNEPSLRGRGSENLLTKKRSITMYNHSTRDSRDVPRADERVVQRDGHCDNDAYSQALSESMSATHYEKRKKNHDTANKIAVTRQNVEKEYKDTIAFLNSLPKNKNTRPINNAFKDDHRLQAHRENRQRILQQEFKNIEQESRRQASQGCKTKSTSSDRSHTKRSKFPSDLNDENNLKDRDFQYSWMPVPESDSNLAVHTIPSARAPARAGVRFGAADGYHEYRSRHKHTPPTKDTSPADKHTNKRIVETVIFQNDDSSSGASVSDTSGADGQQSLPKITQNTNGHQPRKELTDADRIIIYKILCQKHRKKSNPAKINRADGIVQDNERSNNTEKEEIPESTVKEAARSKLTENNDGSTADNNSNPLSSNDLNEGVYKVPANTELPYNGYNVINHSNVGPWQLISDRKYWWDNLESMYYSELNKNQSKTNDSKCNKHKQDSMCCKNGISGDFQQSRMKCNCSKCISRSPERRPAAKRSSCSSYKTASKVTASEAGFVKLIDEGERQERDFYIGATGFLKDDAYEVIIQLRKKDDVKELAKKEGEPIIKSTDAGNENTINTQQAVVESLESTDHVQQEAISASEHSPVETNPQTTGISDANSTQNNKSSEQQRPSSARSDDVPSTKIKHDRSVSPLYKDSSSEPLARSDVIVRPATSTYTQTTLSSPGPRPAYIHMSSSTSTAYMSPPEVVLPNFFRRGPEPCRKAHRSSRDIGRHEGQKHHCKKYSSYKITKKSATEPTIDRMPSSAVSTTAADDGYGTYNIYKGKRDATQTSPDPTLRNNRCPKCKPRRDCKPCTHCSQYSHKTQQQNAAKHSKYIWHTKNSVVRNKKSKVNIHANKSYLNPRIKEYIQKLLSLNREGIKAIQIISQDCSSVNTPASSIINIPTNRSNKTSNVRNLDFSLEQIKHVLRQRIYLNEIYSMCRPDDATTRENVIPRNLKLRKRNPKKKKLHKVKSLNISKKITIEPCDASKNAKVSNITNRQIANNQGIQDSPSSDNLKSHGESRNKNIVFKNQTNKVSSKLKNQYVGEDSSSGQLNTALSTENSSTNSNEASTRSKCIGQPIDTSTQTNRTVDEEMNFIKLAEGKLQNMEKIADLTEKCSKRLSNLAKVLEEVRKTKSLAYSQISTSDSTSSDSDQRPEKIVAVESELNFPLKVSSVPNSKDEGYKVGSTDYESLLSGIREPVKKESSENMLSDNVLSDNSNTDCTSKPATPINTNEEYRVNNAKCRNRPPPALLRINLKRPQENLIPHELSTVIEVDSPSSVKFKSQSSTIDPKKDERCTEQLPLNPELYMSTANKSNNDKVIIQTTDSSDESKLQMMDLNQFNEIMLRPFISLQEYAQDFYEGNTDTICGSIPKEIGFTDDISSFHSDGSLPDVVAELLKRKLITEPFRFDTASNVNSITVSSESTLSALALPKPQKDKSKSKLTTDKENVSEISDSLSISSNPDLENAFKKLGMGWASSTLKKTKERLALSSSSNTSSSSLSQIKFKNSSKRDVLGTDSISSVPNLSKKPVLKQLLDVSKNAEQQTSFTNSMTVKEFLTKELAKKITFTDKSDKNDTNLEFVSLYETKLPEGLKNLSQTMQEDNSGDSALSGNNNRARTSTPVNILKSVTYHSSSSSNMSNGLFSNADDLSSVKLTSTSMRYQSTSEKDELTIPNCSLKMRKALSDCSKTDSC